MQHTYVAVNKNSEDEDSGPEIHIDVSPSQLEGLKVGDQVSITLVGKLVSTSHRANDNWGTGASISVEMASSEIHGSGTDDGVAGLMKGE